MLARWRALLVNVGWSLATLLAGRRRVRWTKRQMLARDFRTQTRGMGAMVGEFARDRLRRGWLRLVVEPQRDGGDPPSDRMRP